MTGEEEKPCFKTENKFIVKSGCKKRMWRSLKQILTAERTLLWPNEAVLYYSINAPPTFKPTKKYSDISGLPAPYVDRHSKLFYASVEEFATVRSLPMDITAGYLQLRGANNLAMDLRRLENSTSVSSACCNRRLIGAIRVTGAQMGAVASIVPTIHRGTPTWAAAGVVGLMQPLTPKAFFGVGGFQVPRKGDGPQGSAETEVQLQKRFTLSIAHQERPLSPMFLAIYGFCFKNTVCLKLCKIQSIL